MARSIFRLFVLTPIMIILYPIYMLTGLAIMFIGWFINLIFEHEWLYADANTRLEDHMTGQLMASPVVLWACIWHSIVWAHKKNVKWLISTRLHTHRPTLFRFCLWFNLFDAKSLQGT